MPGLNDSYRKLRDHWYAKLKKDGFEDIEDTQSQNQYLRCWHSSYFQTHHTPDAFEARGAYFDQAWDFYHQNFTYLGYPEIPPFLEALGEKRWQRQIWELHCQGRSLRQIATTLNTKVCRVHKVIRALTALMKASSRARSSTED